MRAGAILFLACTLAGAQSELTTQTFHFPATDGINDMQSTVNALRSVLGLTQTTFDQAARTMTVQGAAGDIALAAWLFGEMEAPPVDATQSLQISQNPGPAGPNDRLFVYRLAHMNSVEMVNQLQGFQGVVNMVRVIPQLSKVFPRSGNFSIAVRGSEDQLALATWLLQQADQTISAQPRPEQKFQSNVPSSTDVRMLYFAHALTEAQQQPVVNALRIIPELTRVFPLTGKGAIAVGGSADRIAMAEWLFSLLDAAAPQTAYNASARYAFVAGLDLAQVFFLPASLTEQSFDQTVLSVRAVGPNLRAFPDAANRALAIRGTPAQLTEAAQILEQSARN